VTEFDKVIHPGGVGKVSASIHTTTFKGQVAKSVNVTTNDPENQHFTLQLKANILVPLDVTPSENVAFNGKAETLTSQELFIASASKEPFDITKVTPSDENFKVTVTAAPEEGTAPKTKTGTVASGANRYKVTIAPAKGLAVGRLSSTITLATTNPKQAEQVIRVFGNVTGDVEASPQYVTLVTGAGAAPEQRVQHVTVKKVVGDELKILGTSSDNPNLSTSVKTVTAGREYDVEIKYTGTDSTAPLAGKVTIKTNDARQPTVEIQVWGRADTGQHAMAPAAQPVQVHPVPAAPPKPPPAP
jgi:hypothetical protein